MKRIHVGLMALAAIAGAASAFTNAPTRVLNPVYVVATAGGGFTYTTSLPNGVSCQSDVARCVISTNIPLADLPTSGTFPSQQNPSNPSAEIHLRYVTGFPSIYK